MTDDTGTSGTRTYRFPTLRLTEWNTEPGTLGRVAEMMVRGFVGGVLTIGVLAAVQYLGVWEFYASLAAVGFPLLLISRKVIP